MVGARRRQIELQILDTGPGIPVDKQTEVFREFHRLENDTGTERGIGLGLSIVERIAKILDHEIGLRSIPGKGTCFYVKLPTTTAPATAKIDIKPVDPAGSLSGTQVLCIDNEKTVLADMESLLSSWNCVVTTATSADEAVARIDDGAGPIDVILADYHLDNGATGPEAIDAVRTHCGRFIPAAILTADHSSDVKRELDEKDLTVLRKPVKAGALRALLTVLARRQLAAE